jgi:hypothetical protein
MREGLVPRINSDQFRKEVTELVEQELQRALDNVEQTVRAEVTRLVPQIIPALLGLRKDRWGGVDSYEINQTNGIDAKHPLGIAYREAAREKAMEVVIEAIKDWEPSKKMIAAVRTEYADHVGYMTRDAAAQKAAQDATEWAETFVNDVLDGKFKTPGAPSEQAKDVLRQIAEGKLKGAKAVEAAAAALGKET